MEHAIQESLNSLRNEPQKHIDFDALLLTLKNECNQKSTFYINMVLPTLKQLMSDKAIEAQLTSHSISNENYKDQTTVDHSQQHPATEERENKNDLKNQDTNKSNVLSHDGVIGKKVLNIVFYDLMWNTILLNDELSQDLYSLKDRLDRYQI